MVKGQVIPACLQLIKISDVNKTFFVKTKTLGLKTKTSHNFFKTKTKTKTL